jgi:uncharacterized protein YegP (UPF0339 family)
MTYHVYKDAGGKWRWRLKAANGQIVADSGQGYASKQHCKEGIDLVKSSANAPVVDDDED